MPKVKNVSGVILASPKKRRKMHKEENDTISPEKQWDIEEHLEKNQCFVCEEPSFAGM